MKILLVEDNPSVSYFLGEVIQANGHEFIHTANGRDALARFETYDPDLILADIRIPGIDGFQLLEEIRRRNRDVIYVVMTGYGSEEFASRAIELKANNYLNKPIGYEALTTLLNKYAGIVRDRSIRAEVSQTIRRRTLTLEIDNRTERVSHVVDLLVAETRPLLHGEAVFGIEIGLYELIVNAIEHGNLGITYEEKRRALYEASHKYMQLIEKRSQDPERAAKRVRIEFQYTGDRMEWLIADQGEGFNWYSVPSPFETGMTDSLNGRGIYIARFQFDELQFLGTGNRVRATKLIPAPLGQGTPLPLEATAPAQSREG